jgi:polyphenol oxidase
VSYSSFVLGADGIYRSPLLAQFGWLHHGFGTRQANPPSPVTLRQIHSDRVLNAAGLADRELEGDALVTNEVGITIGVRTADCVPLLLVDPQTRTVGAVHAGWRGTAAAISQRAIEKVSLDFGVSPQHVYVAIGPCIRLCCYRVGPEVAARFEGILPEVISSGISQQIDLAEANRRQLLQAGVLSDHIDDCRLCTSCRLDQFFSYRRDPQDPGRLVASMMRIE